MNKRSNKNVNKSQAIGSAVVAVCCAFYALSPAAEEVSFHGLLDVRLSATDSGNSYLNGGYGKFGYSGERDERGKAGRGEQLSVSQLGAALAVQWDSGISAHLVVNGYLDDEDSAAGFTEGYLKYRSLPGESGYRWQTRVGVFYPHISLENNAVAWASKHTLNSSTINTWIGEEIRVLGSEFTLTRLGKLVGNAYDLSLSATAFVNNDPAGTLLAWHGWTMSSRQTLWTESRPIPPAVAVAFAPQGVKSDPFLELNDKPGYHFKGQWKLRGKGQFSLGYYDNNATPYRQENGQYGWQTRFIHADANWLLPQGLQLSAQYLSGDTLMQGPDRHDAVNNGYTSAYVALSKKWQQHRVTLRLEEFSVSDNDHTVGDSNGEYGKAATFNYTRRLSRHWFLATEFNWIDSDRDSRGYDLKPLRLVERQLQLAARYFF